MRVRRAKGIVERGAKVGKVGLKKLEFFFSQPDISSLSGCRVLQPENSSFLQKLEFFFRVG